MIILVARLFGWILKKWTATVIVLEIIAGIVLGPSVELYFPGFSAVYSLLNPWNLKFLSQIGLILFMFVIGMELDIKSSKTSSGNRDQSCQYSYPFLQWVVCLICL
jgi:Kef-type K+ transport system membrane component KefB